MWSVFGSTDCTVQSTYYGIGYIEQLIYWTVNLLTGVGDHHGHDRMVVQQVGFKTTYQYHMQSVPITTDVVGLTPAQGEVYNIMW